MRVHSLHHAQITVPLDAEGEARSFYVDVMGLHEIPKPDALRGRGGFWLRAESDPVELHVGLEESPSGRTTKAHLAWRVVDLAGWRRRIEQAGCVVDQSIPIPGADRFEFRDPFGNRVELIEPHPSAD